MNNQKFEDYVETYLRLKKLNDDLKQFEDWHSVHTNVQFAYTSTDMCDLAFEVHEFRKKIQRHFERFNNTLEDIDSLLERI